MALDDSPFFENLKRVINPNQLSNWGLGIIILASILIESGIIYILAENPQIFSEDPRNGQFTPVQISPTLSTMVVFEMLFIFLVIVVGVIGIYLMRHATSYIDDERGVVILALGIVLFMGSVILLFLLFSFKQNCDYFAFGTSNC